jgi:hypothetical protein
MRIPRTLLLHHLELPGFMRLRALALGTSLVIAGSASAFAQTTTTVKITAGATGTPVTSGAAIGYYPAGTPNFYVSPYAGLVDYVAPSGGTPVSLNCVDYFHHVSVGNVWTANVTNLGSASSNLNLLANTRYGHNADPTAPYDMVQYGNVLTLYKQAAWLTLQYDADPGSTPNKTRAIQSAIWTLFNSYDNDVTPPWFDGPGSDVNDSQWWVNESGLLANKLADSQLQYFSVLTDNTNPWAADSKQEFLIHVTPEPGMIVLMATGLFAVILVVRRRRSAGLTAA